MLEALTGGLAALKQVTPTILLGVAAASAAVLFLPADFVRTIGLDTFRDSNRQYIGGALVLAVALLCAQLLAGVVAWLKQTWEKRIVKQKQGRVLELRQQSLEKLTPHEKAYLLPYIQQQENTQYFGVEDGIAGGLQAKKIIFRSASIGNFVEGFAFNIQPWARDYLNQNQHLLDGAAELSRQDSRWY